MAKGRIRTKEQELSIENRWLKRQLAREKAAKEHFKDVAYFDDLTRDFAVLTRYGFVQRIESRLTEVEANTRRGEPLQNCLLYIDLDDFKTVNDTHGHHVGDLVLKAFASAVQGVLRGSDIIGRVGGDEFAVMARVRGDDGLMRLKTRVEKVIALANVDYNGKTLQIKASIGTTLLNPGDSVERVLDRADKLMYEDKAERKAAS